MFSCHKIPSATAFATPSNNLALRGCPVRRTPCGRSPNHPPLPVVAGDSGLSASETPPTGSRRSARSPGRKRGFRLVSIRKGGGHDGE